MFGLILALSRVGHEDANSKYAPLHSVKRDHTKRVFKCVQHCNLGTLSKVLSS